MLVFDGGRKLVGRKTENVFPESLPCQMHLTVDSFSPP